jgi:hypothetical protein
MVQRKVTRVEPQSVTRPTRSQSEIAIKRDGNVGKVRLTFLAVCFVRAIVDGLDEWIDGKEY